MEATKRILIVDDDEAIRDTLSRILEREGYQTDAVGTGSEAVRKAKPHRYAVALLNYRLPDMTSEQLQARLHARAPQLKIAVLGATPMDPEKLIELVEEKLSTPE